MHLALPREMPEAFRDTQHSYIPQHAEQSKMMQSNLYRRNMPQALQHATRPFYALFNVAKGPVEFMFVRLSEVDFGGCH